jgi:hypothetical protein
MKALENKKERLFFEQNESTGMEMACQILPNDVTG